MKPSTQDTMFVGFLDKTGFHTFVVPLRTLHLLYKDNEVILTIELLNDAMKKIVKENPNNFMLTVSDDPYMTWAGDWSHLGCTRLNLTLNECTMTFNETEHFTIVRCTLENYKQDLVLAERFNTWKDQKPKLMPNINMESVMETYVFNTLDDPILFLKTTKSMEMHATVLNLYETMHTMDTFFVRKGLTEETMLHAHYKGSYEIDGASTVRAQDAR